MSQPCDEYAMAHFELFAELERQAASVSPIPPEVEIDAFDDPDFGAMYRVWRGMALIGTFYRRLDGFYVSRPISTTGYQVWKTDTEAIQAIVEA